MSIAMRRHRVVGRLIHFERLRIFRWFGRRGLLLLLMGSMWIVYGLTLMLASSPPRFTAANQPVPVLSLLDQPAIGWLWAVAGCISVFVSMFRMHADGHDAWGFNALFVPAAVWFLAYLWSIALWLASGETYGRATSASGATAWLIVCTFVLLFAGWMDVDDPAYKHSEGG
jgi:hypothetical protein